MTESQNRDLWFTLPPQRSLLVWWLFSAIPIPILKFLIFYLSNLYWCAADGIDGDDILMQWKSLMDHIHDEHDECYHP